MPPFRPLKRQDLIRHLREPGFKGPYAGGKHQYMLKAETKLAIPNPHQGDIGRELLNRILRQAGIERDEWEKL
jgi:predicted RNA binding protein YcfA (HicA-like mRNA interferase family)